MHEIRMDYPAKNALGHDMMGALEGELDRAGGAPILITGSGGAFSAGLNLRDIASLGAGEMAAFLRRVDALAERLYLHPAPVVAAIDGHAIAGGCVLALCCDWRVATRSPRARIGLNEVALGVCYPPAICAIVRRRLPAQHVERVMLGAELFDPDAALALGLVDELSETPAELARKRLTALSAHPRGAYAHTKSVLRGAPLVDPAAEQRFREVELPIWTSDDVRARVLAVLGDS